MNATMRGFGVLGSLIPVVLLALGGCKKEALSTGLPKDGKNPVVQKKPHDHSGWWCDEHGVPEAECSMCSARAAAEFKKKGDWCKKHDRAKSQCFICDPSLEAKYAARYEAKYGKKPPVPEENRAKKETPKEEEGK
jgi:hypothetical protein